MYGALYNFIRKSKKGTASYWPIWLVLNELQPEIRFKKDNVRLFGIWFGREKPHMNTFLKPLTQMFINSWQRGNLSFILSIISRNFCKNSRRRGIYFNSIAFTL